MKEAQAKERKRKNDLRRTEKRIQELEEREEEINALLLDEEVFTNTRRLVELNKEQEANQKELDDLYELWAELAE